MVSTKTEVSIEGGYACGMEYHGERRRQAVLEWYGRSVDAIVTGL